MLRNSKDFKIIFCMPSHGAKFFSSILCVCLCIAVNAASTKKSGTITAGETWSDTILIAGDVTINAATVTVSSGATIIFGAGLKINVACQNGILDFEGTESRPIIIKGGVNKSIGAYGRLFMRFCRIDSCNIGAASGASESPCMIFEDNIVTNGDVACCWKPGIIRRNYIHDPQSNNQIVLSSAIQGSLINDNIVLGGTWVTGNLGGTISGNVFISREAPAGSTVDKNTHEQMFGVRDSTILERNIFIGKSYGAVMGIGDNNAAHTLVRNNTFDLRASGDAIIFHQTNSKPTGMIVRNNIFMRCGAMNDEGSTTNSIVYTDYNLFASVSTRYKNIKIEGKNVGDEGNDKHSIPTGSSVLLPGDVVVNPEFGYPFPYSDSDMLKGNVTFTEALSAYRSAYSLKTGSSAINAGAPQDSSDLLVSDKKCDMGAIEYTGKPYNQGPSISNIIPAEGATITSADTVLSFDITDPDTVDAASLKVMVNGVDVIGQCKIANITGGKHITYKPISTHSSGTMVTILIKASNKKGNVSINTLSISIKTTSTRYNRAPSPVKSPRLEIINKPGKGFFFNIRAPNKGFYSLQIIDILGKKCWEHNGQNEENSIRTIVWNPINGLKKGTYVAKLHFPGYEFIKIFSSIN